jgi:hypothetical protein
MKVALCFIISYNHKINKEQIWRDWIEPNKDIINIYFHYKNIHLIESTWIKQHCIPSKYIAPTTYYHVVPAYMSILSFAFSNDIDNKWFCLLTESCVPIISPSLFRKIFFYHHHASIIGIKPAYWNIDIHHRANLRLLHKDYHLANDPWFTLTRDHVHKTILFMIKKQNIYQTVCKGGLANESIFAIVLQTFNETNNKFTFINMNSTISDWSRMDNATSPYLFKKSDEPNFEKDKNFIYNELKKNKFALFLRKVSYNYPDDILLQFIYNTDLKHEYIQLHTTSPTFMSIMYVSLVIGLCGFICYNYFLYIFF